MGAIPGLKIVQPPPIELEKVALCLPRMGIGFALAVMALVAEAGLYLEKIPAGPAITARLLISLFAWIYWMFCIFRIHRIMAGATHRTYKVSPFGAIWPQFIPIYCWVWAVQWTRRLAKFLKSAKPGLKMGEWWPGLMLLMGSLAGMLLYFTCLHLFVMFGVGIYLNRKIRQVVPFARTAPIARKQQLSLAWTAGLGAGFGLVLCQAGQEFFRDKKGGEQLEELAVITLVSLGIIKFVEPLADWVRSGFHRKEHHHQEHDLLSKHKRILAALSFLALAFSSFSHGLLENYFKHQQQSIQNSMWDALRTLAVMLIVSGGITYAWVAGARRRRLRAGLLGLISGCGLALVLIVALFLAFDSPLAHAVAVPGTNAISKSLNAILSNHPAFILCLIGSHGNPISTVAASWLLWGILGLVGGLAIDRKWGGGSTRHVVLSVLLAALIVVLALRFTQMANSNEIALGVAAVLGWCLSLLIYPDADKVLKPA